VVRGRAVADRDERQDCPQHRKESSRRGVRLSRERCGDTLQRGPKALPRAERTLGSNDPATTAGSGVTRSGYSVGPYLGRFYCTGVSQRDGGARETCHHNADTHAGAITGKFRILANPNTGRNVDAGCRRPSRLAAIEEGPRRAPPACAMPRTESVAATGPRGRRGSHAPTTWSRDSKCPSGRSSLRARVCCRRRCSFCLIAPAGDDRSWSYVIRPHTSGAGQLAANA